MLPYGSSWTPLDMITWAQLLYYLKRGEKRTGNSGKKTLKWHFQGSWFGIWADLFIPSWFNSSRDIYIFLAFLLCFYPLIKQCLFVVLQNTFFLNNDCQNTTSSFFFCCCCQDQKVCSLSPLSAPWNNCDPFTSRSVSSVKCLSKVHRQEIFTQGALYFRRGLSSASVYEAIKRFRLVFTCVCALKLRQETTVKKKMFPWSVNAKSNRCAPFGETKYVVWDLKKKNLYFFCIQAVITEVRK